LDRNDRSAYHKFLRRLGYQPDDKANNDFTRGFATQLPVEHSKPSFLAQEASNFILKHRAEPWMLYVNFLEPHTPFSSALNELHSLDECPLPKNFPGVPERGEPDWYVKRRATFQRPRGFEGNVLNTPEAWRSLQRNYAGLCSLVDQALGRILWALEASGARENTIIVYTSDHGEMMGSHQMLTKQVMYEEACHVPYLLRVPFRKQMPARVKAPVSHIDFVPTLLDLMGKKDVPGLAGETAVAMLEGKARRENDVFLQWTKEGASEGPNARCVITPEGQKLVLHDADRSMLFDHARDPYELNNLYGAPAAAATQKRLRGKIEAWQKRFSDKIALPA
jgi:arylsulfatase A-like enzyme